MARRRVVVWILAGLLLIMALTGYALQQAWREWREASGIEQLEWQGLRITWTGLAAERLFLTRQVSGKHLHLEGRGIALEWTWQDSLPGLDRLSVDQLVIDIPSWSEPEDKHGHASGQSLPQQLPHWIPGELEIREFSVALPTALTVHGHLSLSLEKRAEPWLVAIDDAQVRTKVPELAVTGWKLDNLEVALAFSGQVSQSQWVAEFSQSSRLHLGAISGPDSPSALAVSDLVVKPGQLQLVADPGSWAGIPERLEVQGPLEITAQKIQHSSVKPQTWHLHGSLDGTLDGIGLSGRLAAESGMGLDLTVHYPFDGDLSAHLHSRLAGDDSGKVLADTLSDWPESLEVGAGEVSLEADIEQSSERLRLNAQLQVEDLSGTYNRMAWQDLNGSLSLNLDNRELSIHTSGLEADQLNPGIPLGPVVVSGHYQGVLDRPLQEGLLELDQAMAGFLGGEVHVESSEWRLDKRPWRVVLQLHGVELARLMQVYPAEGLSGTGLLNGTVPLLGDPGGIRVENGRVSAAPPGGTLSFPADRLSGLAQGNRTMELVTRALQNFHYSVLNSTIDYAEDGTLLLGLRLEGRSPDVREGHPIVLNVSLEEDIPALLTSLQLSGRVNETVTERVRNLMRKREAADSVPGAEDSP